MLIFSVVWTLLVPLIMSAHGHVLQRGGAAGVGRLAPQLTGAYGWSHVTDDRTP